MPIPPQWIDPLPLQADLMKLTIPGKHRNPEQQLMQARARMAKKWLPALQGAEAAGDPIATLILRDCASVPELERDNIDTTCSSDAEARERAVARLRALDIGYLAEQTGRNVPRQITNNCTADDQDRCMANTAIQLLENRLRAIENDALVASLSPWNISACPDLRKTPALQELGERCETLRHQLLAVKTLAQRYFILSLADHPEAAARTRAHPYAHFDDVRSSTGNATNDDEFHNRFYGAVYRSLHTMEANIKVRLVRDPRWRVFLRETPADLERPPKRSKKSARQAEARAPTVRLRDAVIMQRYVGTYEGTLISSGTTSVITKLFPSGSGGLQGRYLMVYGREIGARVERGSLGPCLVPASREILCIWRDRFGIGSLSMLFDAEATEFRGLWRSFKGQSEFARMEPRFWNETTLWNGKLQ
ncbi:MAG: hypothetical protein KKF85_06940 [Gammaproteobacteria bacterium]|nr:hypothetical protein [Rhodocyclaceae bacterium]MBU3907747.1 hypothetical protein [Gammaproteobacteria bacterium]MBU3989821.1 hypothetical protein [Gammaproteobacteria bacterium]MBU4004393.1 hypothetical protein [Gammaproteobacteria bacterium]MBU4019802.1 hypothetical protein [Gammaproteobacteria bacterium]